jgi:Cu2+-exporting ATPase
MASAIIRGAGLERYYTERQEPAPRPDPFTDGDWQAVEIRVTPTGSCEARLVLDGLRCASCVWVTEKVLERTPGVEHATVSYATGRATLRWNPARVDLGALVRRIAALGYRSRPLGVERAADPALMRRMGFAVVGALAIMGMYEGLYAGWWFGAIDPRFAAMFRWGSLLLATPLTLWCAEPFFTAAWRGLKHRVLSMDLPVALGIALLYLHGVFETLHNRDSYLDSLSMLVALLLVGRVLEARGRRRATEAAQALACSVPRTARRLHDERIETVAVEELRPGDIIDAGAGEELAADGQVTAGSGQVRMALITGEATPVLVGPGDRVVAGTLLLDGALSIEVQSTGRDTVVHRMAEELASAQDQPTAPGPADRIAPWFTLGTLVVAVATLAGWWYVRGVDIALARTVAVLVVACPCALALAEPLATAAGLGAAARRGLLLRSSSQLLELGQVELAAFDKTGTVTMGDVAVIEASDAVLRIAAGLERYSSHPIARAITTEAGRRGIPLPAAEGIRETAGAGIEGTVDGARWQLASAGPGAVVLRQADGDVAADWGIIQLGDGLRPEAARAIARLAALGVKSAILTGDHADIAASVALATGVPRVHAELRPEAKAEWIRARRASGIRVLFAGDGLNDGPALAAANVGLAMARGSASSILVADGIIAGATLEPVVAGIRASRAARRMVHRSLWQSIGYNALSVAAAAAGLVNPLVAAILMPLSSALVIWNATRVEALVRRGEQ